MENESKKFGGEGAFEGMEYTISDIARLYAVSLRTLRFYEDKGLLCPRRRGTSRFYSQHDRVRLELILKGKKLGFSLAEIQQLISSRTRAADVAGEDIIVRLDRQQIAAQIAHLERQRDDLEAAIAELYRAYKRMEETVA